jgi:hypothetical protein
MLCMPIRDNYANVVAVVQAINKLDGVFTMTDELLLTSVAIQARYQMDGSQSFPSIKSEYARDQASCVFHHKLFRVEYQAIFFTMGVFAEEGIFRITCPSHPDFPPLIV